MLASLVVAMILPGSHAGHGLDNNWTVAITGMKDANDCLRVSSIEDLGANLAGAAGVSCVSSSSTCTDNYDCDAAKAKKPRGRPVMKSLELRALSRAPSLKEV